jgi:tetratricopeptide (TPR) repeat protein
MVSKPVYRMGCMWVAVALALPAPVVAQPAAPATADDQVKKVEALAAEAQAKYAEGKYQDAIRLYLQAHQLVAEPAILYNVAVIYDQQVRDPEIATEYYRRYIMDPGADPEAVTKATQRIQELRAQREAAAAVAASAPASRPAPAPASTAEATPNAGADARSGSDGGLSTTRLAVGWGLVGLGAALGVAGGIFGGLAEDDEHAFTDSGDIVEKRDLRDRGQQRALAADIFFGGAGAAVVAGVVVLLTGERGGRDGAPRAGVTPTPGGAQATFDFRF